MFRRSAGSIRALVVFSALSAMVVGKLPGASAAEGAPAPAPVPAPAGSELPPFVPGRVLVGFQPGTGLASIADLRGAMGVVAQRLLGTYRGRAEAWELPSGMSVPAVITALQKFGIVRYAEPDWKVTSMATSNDPYVTAGSLWGMYGDASTPSNQYGSQAAEAWAQGATGSADVYVGIIDEGIDFSHPDLDGNIWTNPFETPGNGRDDDGNGYTDDMHGWDFFHGDASVYDAGEDQHGTHVAGTIGGEGGNGIGVAGVNWDVTFISGKFLGPGGGSILDAVDAVKYFTDLKVRHGLNIVATSNSWGGGGYSQALLDAIDQGGDQGILFIAAAGNSGWDNDTTPSYPSNYQCTDGGTRGWDCVVAVAAIQSNGAIASFSQYGDVTVDLGAPGVDVISTQPGNSYASFSGTSMATPHVSGAVALCASMNPALSGSELRSALMDSVAPTTSLATKTVSGGRLDVASMLASCTAASDPVVGAPTDLVAIQGGATTINLTWTDSSSNESSFEIQRASGVLGTCSGWTTAAFAPKDAVSARIGGLASATDFCFRIRARNTYGGGSVTAWSNDASARTAPPPAPYTCPTTTYAWIDPTLGTRLSMSATDDGSAEVDLPFGVTFYGEPFTTATVSTNGYLVLGGGSGTIYSNVTIPSTADPNAIVAAFWDDLVVGPGGIFTRTVGDAPNRSFVVGWVDVRGYGATGTGSFEIVFDEASGAISLQYLDVDFGSTAFNLGKGATVGLEAPSGTLGTRISFNAGNLAAGRAYRCSDVVPPVSIATSTLASAVAGSSYRATLSGTAGTTPYAWSIDAGSLPAGLTLSSAGVLSGTPTEGGAWTFTVKVTDSSRTPSSATKVFTLAVGLGKRAPASGSTLARGATSASLQWFAHANATEYRYCIAQRASLCTAWTSVGGSTSASVSGLAIGKTYYWQVQALVGGVWVNANSGSLWTFKTRR